MEPEMGITAVLFATSRAKQSPAGQLEDLRHWQERGRSRKKGKKWKKVGD